MVVEIYGAPASAPYRIAAMAAEAAGAPYELKLLKDNDHRADWYVKMNPQHNMPFMKDGDLGITESRAIATYLVNKYAGEDSKLYPKDPTVRAMVDQRLYFDMGAFYKAFADVIYPQFVYDPRPPGKIHDFEGKLSRMKEVLGWADDFASQAPYIAGTDHFTLADIAFAATYATIVDFDYFDLSPYKSLNAWLARVEQCIPKYQELNKDGAEEFAKMFKKA